MGTEVGRLTPRQAEAVRLAAEGLTDRQVGERMGISPRTASNYLHQAYAVLGVRGRRDLHLGSS